LEGGSHENGFMGLYEFFKSHVTQAGAGDIAIQGAVEAELPAVKS
jgi:hypothetical protein